MSNGKLQTEQTAKQPVKKEPEKRKSIIHKGIERTLNTDKYESIVIRDFIEEEIEWTDLEERARKIQNWETIFLADFKRYHDSLLTDLNLSHKKSYEHNSYAERIKPGVGQRTELSNLLDDLDTLDAETPSDDDLIGE